ncbi:endonuclease MutS2 [Oscillatoriales cyanobacterium LEGE 11467]|uniref:Endonuclease MutS2 n=1 Tax=Zarconia navalis LEGE 11467 TaxID=1828826 RepID=A0A928VYP3_9CYAN|nr:endonuclease MutS2 [Zarconia navalis]MBE9042059.1 endonuclease MutS2 [Zarconia navalis LEGE 11467]
MIQAETLELLEWPRLCQHLSTFAATKLGRVAAQNLQVPTTPADSLELLAQTQETYGLETDANNSLSFEGIHDIGESLERAELQGILSGDELLNVATTLTGARQLRRTIDDRDELPVLQTLVAALRTYPELDREIHRCIDERGKVTGRARPELGEIRQQLKSVRDRIYQILQQMMQRQANALQDRVITKRGDRFVIPVKADRQDAIRGIVHDTSTTGATLYVEPHAIVAQNNKLRQLQRREEAIEETVRRELTEQIAEVREDLERLLAIVTTLDLATARARYSLWLEANPPRFLDLTPDSTLTSPITLRQLRHPLLVWQHKHEQGTEVVPVNLNIAPHIRVVTITGPNTGGKTVTLKTLGLAVLMAKVGLFVPAREPVELPWFSQVLADIGDEQSLEQSLSTFSGHIRRISRILDALESDRSSIDPPLTPPERGTRIEPEEAEEAEAQETIETTEPLTEENEAAISTIQPFPPLVLFDEVGAGTDPTEGSALAIALLNYLADRAGLTIATTHFGELKALKYEDDRFENASVEFDDVSLSPTYRLLWGIPGRSNALTIARRLGLTSEVVDRAETYVAPGGNSDVNQVISGLEAQRRQQETKAQEASQLVEQAERLNREIAEKAVWLKEREQKLKQEQEHAVQQAISQAKGDIAKVIRDLQKGSATAQDAQKATVAVDRIANRKLPSRSAPPKPKPGFRPQIGDRIRIPSLGQTAEVLSEPDKDGELAVRFGIMKMTVKLVDIESLDGKKPELPPSRPPKAAAKAAKSTPAPSPATAPLVQTSQNTVDLRGSRIADAELQLENAIGKAVPVGGALWIIHGKGTGRLRQGVQEFLDRSPHIDRYELAQEKNGGAGVTIAYLK